MKKYYKILKHGKMIKSKRPGKYAGCRSTGIFGKVHDACLRGLAMNKANRVFFHTLEDAIEEGYRPCKACKPINNTEFEKIRHLVPFTSLAEFYETPRKRSSLVLVLAPLDPLKETLTRKRINWQTGQKNEEKA